MSDEAASRKSVIVQGTILVVALVILASVLRPESLAAWIEAGATVGLVAFAWLQLDREDRTDRVRRRATESERQEHRRAVRARVSVLAFLLRRQLRSWLGSYPHDVSIWNWVERTQQDRSFDRHLDMAERRVLTLARLAPECDAKDAAVLDSLFLHFLVGTEDLNRVADALAANREINRVATSPPQPWSENARWFFEKCIPLLESVIRLELLERHGELVLNRAHPDPLI
jgi:hypothetical protein